MVKSKSGQFANFGSKRSQQREKADDKRQLFHAQFIGSFGRVLSLEGAGIDHNEIGKVDDTIAIDVSIQPAADNFVSKVRIRDF